MDKIYLKQILKGFVILSVAGIAYYIFYTSTGLGVPCVFRAITGYKCPGCGVTHMAVHMSHMELIEAYNDNQLLFLTWPFVISEVAYSIYLRAKQKNMPCFNKILLIIYIFVLIGFGVLRNLLKF